jgi:hypothetical protein
MVARDSGCNVRDVKRQSQRGQHSEGRRKGKSRDCRFSKALLTRWFKRVRAATLIFATFRPLFRLGGRWSASIPFDHRSLRQPDPAQQVSVTGIGAEIVDPRVSLDFIEMTC